MVFKISCFSHIFDLKKSQIRKFGTVRNTRYMLSNHFSTKLPERFSVSYVRRLKVAGLRVTSL